jgi:hypothetical protein
MPSESIIRKKAIEILNKDGWITWHPARARFKQNDVFGIIDLLAAKKKNLKKIQLTTLTNISTRRKKIASFLKQNDLQMTIEIWAWSQKEKKFRREKVRLS